MAFEGVHVSRISNHHFRLLCDTQHIKILQVTDTHFSSDVSNDLLTGWLLENLLETHSPNFILHTGDLENDCGKRGLKWFVDREAVWSLALGNHDPDNSGSGSTIDNLEQILVEEPNVRRRDALRRGFVFGYLMNTDFTVGPDIERYDWSSGWTTAEVFTVGGDTYMFFLKADDGTVHIHRMNTNGTVGPEVERHDWSSGWTTAEVFTVGGETYMFFLKAGDGTVHIHRMNANGTVGPEVEHHDWSSGWTTAEVFTVGGETYMFFLKAGDGTVHIHRMNANGMVGPEVERHDWSSGWTTAEVFTVESETYMFFLKAGDGTVHIHRMNANGTVGAEIERYEWTSGWTAVKPYTIGGETYMFFLKAGDGTVHIHRMNANGTVGPEVERHDWSSGWTTAEVFTVESETYMFFLKAGDGTVRIHRMKPLERKEHAYRVDFCTSLHGAPSFCLFVFDSRNRGVTTVQLDWFKSQMQQDANDGVGAPVVAAIHIPVKQFASFRANDITGVWSEEEPGKNRGANRVWYEGDDGTTFEVLRQSGRLKAIFSGHDHSNSFYGLMNGVELVYGRVSGWGGYSPKDEFRGARLIKVDLQTGKYTQREVGPMPSVIGPRFPRIPNQAHGIVGPHRFRITHWKPGWSTATSYRIGDQTYALFMKQQSGHTRVDIYEVNNDGNIGHARHKITTWSAGWNAAAAYKVGNQIYALFMKQQSGHTRVDIHEVNNDGNIGELWHKITTWSAGWNAATAYKVGNQTYALFMKQQSGHTRVDIHEVNNDGNIGHARHKITTWSAGWNAAAAYKVGNQTYALFMKQQSGHTRVDIHEVNNDGNIGELWHKITTWNAGWNAGAAYEVGNQTYALIMKQEPQSAPRNTWVDIHEIT